LMGEDSDQGNDGSDSRWPPLPGGSTALFSVALGVTAG
jgi:hypothetical protein